MDELKIIWIIIAIDGLLLAVLAFACLYLQHKNGKRRHTHS